MIDLDYTLRVRLPIVALTVIVTYGVAFWIGTPTRKGIGYHPDQPIAFSHELHAGQMQMDCRYCHQGVEKSRHATIPSVDTCMNCHSVIETAGKTDVEGFNFDKVVPRNRNLASVVGSIVKATADAPEALAKDLSRDALRHQGEAGVASVLNGILDDSTKRDAFIKHYQDKKDWQDKSLGLLLADHGDAAKAQQLARFMMDEMFTIDSYKSAELKKLRAHARDDKPLRWKRVYRLPEYVYFNHSVHVNKGIDCSKCHGDVTKMDTVKQTKPYDMGRCLDCHRGDYHAGLKEEVRGPESCSTCHR